MKRLFLLLLLSASAPLALAADDISKVNGSIQTQAGNTYGDLETVNGGIQLAAGVQANSVETVNGSVRTEDNVQAHSIETVNGAIRGGRNLVLTHGLDTVNGGIYVDRGSRIGGNIETVNGSIGLVATQVGGDVQTVRGNITVGIDSHVAGGLRVEKSTGFFNNDKKNPPRIVIGPNAVVQGPLVFERPVTLYVHKTAKIGPVTGATAQSFDGDTAPKE